jgi:hypothetical protein
MLQQGCTFVGAATDLPMLTVGLALVEQGTQMDAKICSCLGQTPQLQPDMYGIYVTEPVISTSWQKQSLPTSTG